MSSLEHPASAEAGPAFGVPGLLIGVLVFAPLIFGGNRPLPLLVLELAALLILAAVVARPEGLRHLSWPIWTLLVLTLTWPLLQLVPLGSAFWQHLPGRDLYFQGFGVAGLAGGDVSITLSPWATERAWLALLPPVAVFLATVTLSHDDLKRVALWFLGIAVVQGLIGLAQFGTGNYGVIFPVDHVNAGPARNGYGTYASYDHLAGLLEMALPLGLALLAANFRQSGHRQHRASGKSWRRRLAQGFSRGFNFNRAAFAVAICLGLLLGLVFTRSRTGVLLAMLGILLCAVFFARKVGGERSAKLTTVLTVLGLAAAVEIGLAPVLERFVSGQMSVDARWSIYAGTLVGISEFFPLGSGTGTFPEVFRRFQPDDVPFFVNRAHNDYLEWVFDGGLVAAALIAGYLLVYLLRWRQVWTREHWSELRFLKVGAGIGLLLLGLHGLVDFNLHIPANAIYFAFLSGLFFHPERAATPRPASPGETPPKTQPVAPQTPAPAFPPQEQIPNPFA